jgi:asparagine synthase (glutamine-hydrolysing)
MCGIAGILSTDPAHVSPDRLKKMTDAIAHRGPDGEKTWIGGDERVGLGHRRLAIIDLSEEAAQPMHYLDRYTIVHNGEIYNYRELRDFLSTRGYHFSTRSDTETILAAYDHYGPSCLLHFDGMFAFAIWDEREKKLFLARDRFGEKPLFFYHDKEQFLFASEMKSLWAAGVKRSANKKMVFNFLTLGYTQNPVNGFETFYSNISRLPARSMLVYEARTHQWHSSAWWDIAVEDGPPPQDEEAIGRFHSLFSGSVNRRLRSDVPVGASLSGGLDSSSVLATMLRQEDGTRRIPTFSAVFPGFEKDESAHIASVTRHLSADNPIDNPIDNRYVTPTADQLTSDLDKIAWHQEEPFSSSGIYAQYRVFGLAAERGVKVLLDGQGADELLAGYHKYYHWYWQELYKTDKKKFAHELDAARNSGAADRWTWRNRLAANLPVYAGIFLKRRRAAAQRNNKELTRDFVGQHGVSYYEIPHLDKLNGVLYYNTFMNGMEELLRYADRNSMAHGLEVRLPFLDHQLVEFLFSLPSDFKIRDGWTKWLLRVSMEGALPQETVWRRDKTGFESPQQEWMQNPALQERIQEARRSLVRADILDPSVLNKRIQPRGVHEGDNYDWRYLTTSACMQF